MVRCIHPQFNQNLMNDGGNITDDKWINKGKQWQMRQLTIKRKKWVMELPIHSLLNLIISFCGTSANTHSQTQSCCLLPLFPRICPHCSSALPPSLPASHPPIAPILLWMQSQLYPPSQLFGSQALLGFRHHHTCVPVRPMQWPWINLFCVGSTRVIWPGFVTLRPIRAFCWCDSDFLCLKLYNYYMASVLFLLGYLSMCIMKLHKASGGSSVSSREREWMKSCLFLVIWLVADIMSF